MLRPPFSERNFREICGGISITGRNRWSSYEQITWKQDFTVRTAACPTEQIQAMLCASE
jgi:hypothetical protein